MLPLFFQVILLDSPTGAGLRLVVPSFATPVGGFVGGWIMSRHGCLSELLRVGCIFMMLGNLAVSLLKFQDARWKYFVYLTPANLGQGIAYPSILFTFLAAFEHHGEEAS